MDIHLRGMDPATWAKVKARAKADGLSAVQAVRLLLRLYAAGKATVTR